VRAAQGNHPRDEEWLLIEWPKGEAKPTRYFLCTLPADMSLKELVAIVKMRWRSERDYRELKQEVGLGNYEGRNWRGFHHHASLCIAAYGFLMSERLSGFKKKSRSTQNPCCTRGLLPARRSRRCSGTFHGPSPACASVWLERLHGIFHSARVAGSSTGNDLEFSNTVQLAWAGIRRVSSGILLMMGFAHDPMCPSQNDRCFKQNTSYMMSS
jgi:hypothetical protein